MPLLKGTANIGSNIGELIRSGHAPDQAAAIAYHYAEGEDSAAGIIYKAGDSVLLLLRSAAAGDFPLTWCWPGGSIDEGETAEQAAIRESTEEVGHTPADALRFVDWREGFTTYVVEVPEPFVPVLNGEHLGYAWCPLSALPQPMHPGCLVTLGRAPLTAPVAAMDEKVIDGNGWFEIKANPISKAGVFPYSGRQLGLTGPDADKIFQVLRPPEELADPECVASFRLLPWVDEHTMLGPTLEAMSPSAKPAEQKGVAGVIGENVFFKDGTLFGNIKAFSSTLAALIAAGKRELSAGYRCIYEMSSGVWNGQAYDAIQRKIRGNHLALVKEGRMGPDVAVMDHFTFSFDAMEAEMADNTEGAGGGSAAMSLADVIKLVSELAPQVAKLTEAFAAMGGAQAGATTPAEPAEDAPGAPGAAAAAAAPAEGGAKQVDKTAGSEGTPAGVGMDAAELERSIMKRIARRDTLARSLSAVVGTFDHAEKTLEEVAAYGVEKLGIKVAAGQELVAVESYLQAKPSATPAATVAVDAAEPGKSGGSFIDAHIKGGN